MLSSHQIRIHHLTLLWSQFYVLMLHVSKAWRSSLPFGFTSFALGTLPIAFYTSVKNGPHHIQGKEPFIFKSKHLAQGVADKAGAQQTPSK